MLWGHRPTSGASAGPIAFSEQPGYLHVGGTLEAVFDTSSPGYSESLVENLGTVGWSWTTTTGGTLLDVVFLAFLDSDIDATDNSSSNEFGRALHLYDDQCRADPLEP